MAETSLNVIITSDPAGAITGLRAVKDAADASAGGMTKSFDKATSETGNLFTRLGQTMANWGIPFSNSITNMGKQLDEAKSHGKGFQQAMVDTGGVLTAVGAVAIAGIGYESIKMASNFDTAQAVLRNSIQNLGGHWDTMSGQVDAVNTRMRALGISDTESEQIQNKLVTTTGNYTAGLKYATLAADVAAGTHKDVIQVSQALGMALDGNISRLKRMGIDTGVSSATLATLAKDSDGVRNAQQNLSHVQDEVNSGQLKGQAATYALSQAHQKLSDAEGKLQTDQGAVAKAIDEVTRRFHGDAAAAADTLQGKMRVVGAEFDHVGVTIGNALIPVLETLGGALGDVIGWFTQGSTAAHAVEAAIAALGATLIGAFVVNKVTAAIESVTKALTSLGIITAADTVDEEANAAATDTMGASHAAAAGEIEGSSGAMGGFSIAGMGAGSSMLFLAGAAAVVIGTGLGIKSYFDGFNVQSSLAGQGMDKLNNILKNDGPAAALAAAQATDRESDSFLHLTQRLKDSGAYMDALLQHAHNLAAASAGLTSAQDDVAQAGANLNSVLQQTPNDTQAVSQAQDTLRQSIGAQMDAIAQNIAVQEQGKSAQQRAVDTANAQRGALQTLAAQYPSMDGYIFTYINSLAQIPTHVTTTVSAETTQAVKNLQDVQTNIAQIPRTVPVQIDVNKAVGAAEGMILDKPTFLYAGEAGKEVVIPLTNPARAAELAEASGLLDVLGSASTGSPVASVASAGGGGGGGPFFQIIVNAPVGADLAAAGQQIIQAVEAAERRTGTDWRQRTHR